MRHGPLLGMLATAVVGCAGTPSAPIEDRSSNPSVVSSSQRHAGLNASGSGSAASAVAEGAYTVKKGDTLFAIAFVLNIPMEQLAAINGLRPPYAIYPGQVLKTKQITSGAEAASLPATVTVQPGDTLYGIARLLGVPMQSLIDANQLSAPYSLAVGQVLLTQSSIVSAVNTGEDGQATGTPGSTQKRSETPPAVSVAGKATSRADRSAMPKKLSPALGPVSRWRWPSDGRLERAYSTNLHKGIDIAGRRGDPVRATARGIVVYAGTGVKGYGALIIIKHNDDYLSAYGHNEVILVSEGDVVEDAAIISRMGSTGTDTVKLHFEIRRQGKPIDPIRVLPRRSSK